MCDVGDICAGPYANNMKIMYIIVPGHAVD